MLKILFKVFKSVKNNVILIIYNLNFILYNYDTIYLRYFFYSFN